MNKLITVRLLQEQIWRIGPSGENSIVALHESRFTTAITFTHREILIEQWVKQAQGSCSGGLNCQAQQNDEDGTDTVHENQTLHFEKSCSYCPNQYISKLASNSSYFAWKFTLPTNCISFKY